MGQSSQTDIVDLSELPYPGESGEYTRSFQEVYENYRGRLFRFCYSKLHDNHEAEDVTQETFARAWRGRLDFDDEQRAYAWLRVVASNLCVDVLRRRGRCETAAYIEPDPAHAADQAVLRSSDQQAVRQAMGKLKERHRQVLDDRERLGRTYEEMASSSGTSIASIESLLWRARQALKREVLALAGPDGLLGAVPFIALALRWVRSGRAPHALRLKLTRWSSVLTGSPVFTSAATLVGLSPAIVVVAMGGASTAAATPPTAMSGWVAAAQITAPTAAPLATVTMPTPATPPTPSAVAGVPAASSGAPLVVTTSTPSAWAASRPLVSGGRVKFQDPVSSTKADNSRDRSMPVSVGVGNDTVGVDPAAAIQPVAGVTGTATSTGAGLLQAAPGGTP